MNFLASSLVRWALGGIIAAVVGYVAVSQINQVLADARQLKVVEQELAQVKEQHAQDLVVQATTYQAIIDREAEQRAIAEQNYAQSNERRKEWARKHNEALLNQSTEHDEEFKEWANSPYPDYLDSLQHD